MKNKNFSLLILSLLLLFSLGMKLSSSVLQTISNLGNLRDFQLVNKSSGWVITGNEIFWTSNFGKDWVNISPTSEQSIRTAKFLDSTTGFVASSNLNSDNTISFNIFKTNDGGISWTEREITRYPLTDPDASVDLIRFSFSDPNSGWVYLKRMTSSNFEIGSHFRTTDGGKTWIRQSFPAYGEVFLQDSMRGFIIDGIQDQKLYHSYNNGNAWEVFDPSPEHVSLVSLPYFISGTIADIFVFEQLNNGTNLKIYNTSDSGRSWTEKTSETISENDWIYTPISSVPGEIIILTPEHKITYWQTAELLEIETRASNENISRFEMADTNYGWAIAHQMVCLKTDSPQSCSSVTNLLQTQDGGISWSEVAFPQPQMEMLGQEIPPITSNSIPILSRTSLHTGQGFDQCEISSTSNLQKWKTNSPYSVVNLYIGGKARGCPNVNLSPEFIGALSIQGWKFIPTWVGPQAACTTFSVTMSSDPDQAYSQGQDQAIDAARIAMKLGLSEPDQSGTVIYYDLEAFDTTNVPCLNAAKRFISGWVEKLHSFGVTAGVYGSVCSSGLKEFYTISNPPDVIWPAWWVNDSYYSAITPYNLPCITNSMWGGQQRVLQYTGPHLETWGNTAMYIDLDVIDGIVADISRVVGTPPSVLENISFEEGTLPPWEISPNESACGWQISNTANQARSGDYFLGLSKAANQTSCEGLKQTISLTPVVGDTYKFAVWVKSTSAENNRSLRLAINGLGTVVESTSQKFSGIDNNWMCLEVSHTINQNNLTGIQVQVLPEDADGIEMLLDDAQLSLNTGPLCSQVIPPTGLTASDGADFDSVYIQWDNVIGATYYKIYRAPDQTSTKTQIGLVTNNQFIDQDGEYFESNYYWVKACNANSCSVYSPPEKGTFASPFLDFIDGFESGSTSKWIERINPEKIWVCGTNPISGSYQLCLNANLQTSAYLIHNMPNATNKFDISFKLDPNSATLGSRTYTLLEVKDSSLDKIAVSIKLSYSNSAYKIRAEGQDNSGQYFTTNWYSITDGPSTIDISWNSTISHLRAASTYSGFTLEINNVEKANIRGINNFLIHADRVVFGSIVSQPNSGASGQFYLDDVSINGPLFIRPKSP